MSNSHEELQDTITFSESTSEASPVEDFFRKLDENVPSDVQSTLKKLEKHGADSIIVRQSLLVASKGLKNGKKFYVPRDDSDSPLVIIKPKEKGPMNNVTLFASTERLHELRHSFMKTDVLDFSDVLLFSGVNDALCNTIKQVCEAKGGTYKYIEKQTLMTLSPQLATQLVFTVPEHVYLASLTLKDATTVYYHWPHARIKTFEATEQEIVNLPSMGLYLRETDELVAWIMVHGMGSMGMMHTKEAHRRCGYGELVSKALAKELGTTGLTPFVLVSDNSASFNCFRKIGFQELQVVKWMTYTPSNLPQTADS